MMEAGELLGMSERQFRRYRDRFEEEGEAGLIDRRLGKASPKRIEAVAVDRMLKLYRTVYRGWNVKHFHEHGVRDHKFSWGYSWTKTQLQAAGLVERAKRRGAHRRKRERKPCEGMMLHQDGSRHGWLCGQAPLDLIVTMDDATSTIELAFLVEEEGTASTLRGLLEVFVTHGLPCSLYTDRASHYFYTDKAGEAVDKDRPTQVGRALDRLGVEHIPGLLAGGARPFRAHVRHAAGPAGEGAQACRYRRCRDREPADGAVHLPPHNARFAKPAAVAEKAFVAADANLLRETLCSEEERVVGRDNTVAYARLKLQLPESRLRAHYVKARVKVREYPDGTLAVFHGPRRLCRYDADGQPIDAPTPSSMASCSTPSRRGLDAPALAASTARRPALTASRHEANAKPWVGTKKRASRSKQEKLLTTATRDGSSMMRKNRPWVLFRCPPGRKPKSGQLMCYQNRTTSKATDTASQVGGEPVAAA